MKRLLAALLLTPGLAAAACYVHPDSGITYCTSGSECPAGTAWNASTQACAPPLPTLVCPVNYAWSPLHNTCVSLLPDCNWHIIYEQHDPASVRLITPTDSCPHLELALANLLARLLR